MLFATARTGPAQEAEQPDAKRVCKASLTMIGAALLEIEQEEPDALPPRGCAGALPWRP